MKKRNVFIYLLTLVTLFSCGGNNTPSETSSSLESEYVSEISSEEIDYLPSALESIKKSFVAEGSYSLNSFTHTFKTVFAENSYYNSEYYSFDECPEVVIPYAEANVIYEEGKIYSLHTNLDNTIKKVEQDFVWDDFKNPFSSLKSSDFVSCEEEGIYTLKDELSLEIGNAITNWNHEGVVSASFRLEEGVFSSISMVLSSFYDGDITYEISLSDIGKASTPGVVYETKDYHASLKIAFENFDSTNYTVVVSDSAYSEEDKKYDVQYNFYRTDGMIYDGYNNEGETIIEDRHYKFTVENNKATLKEEVYDSNAFSFTPKFSFAPELFEKVDDSTYKVVSSFLAPSILMYLGITYDIARLGAYYGMDLYIYVENDTFLGYSFNYNVQDLYSNMRLDFSSNGETSMPFEVDFDTSSGGEAGAIIIPTSYIGSYSGSLSVGSFSEGKDVTIIISSSSISINGKEVEITAFDAYEGFTIIYEGNEYYLFDASYDDPISKVMIMSPDYSIYGFINRI